MKFLWKWASVWIDIYFEDENELKVVKFEFAAFSGGRFPSPDALANKWALQPLVWWQYHGSAFPTLQTLTLKLLGQPCSSSCAERKWSTYKFIHSLKRNKMALALVEDLVYMHSNLRLLSWRNEEYVNAATKMWGIAGDSWNDSDIHGGLRILENATLTLDELSWRLWLLGMLALVLLLVKVKFKMKLLMTIRMTVVFDCLEHLSFVLF